MNCSDAFSMTSCLSPASISRSLTQTRLKRRSSTVPGRGRSNGANHGVLVCRYCAAPTGFFAGAFDCHARRCESGLYRKGRHAAAKPHIRLLKIMPATLFGIISAIGGAIGGAIFGTVFDVADAWIRGAAFGAMFGGISVLYNPVTAAIRHWRAERRRRRRRAKGPAA